MKRQYVMVLIFTKENNVNTHSYQGVTEILEKLPDDQWDGEDKILDLVLKETPSIKYLKEGFSLGGHNLVVLEDINSVGCKP